MLVLGKIEMTDWRKLGPTPWAVRYLYDAAAAVVHDDAIAAADLIDQRVRAVSTIRVLSTDLV